MEEETVIAEDAPCAQVNQPGVARSSGQNSTAQEGKSADTKSNDAQRPRQGVERHRMSGIFGPCKPGFAECEARMTEQNQKTCQHHVGSSRTIASDRHRRHDITIFRDFRRRADDVIGEARTIWENRPRFALGSTTVDQLTETL